MLDYFLGAVNGTILANFLVLLIGAIAAVAVGIVLHMFVFGPKAKSDNPGKLAEYANGKRFLPLSVIKVTYYAIAVYLVFMGVSQCILSGYSGINGILQYTILGNVILRIAYEAVLAIRKNAGLDTENHTADEPKVNQPLVQVRPQQPQQYQQPYQQPQPQYQQPYQQPVPMTAPVQQQPAPAPVPQPAPVPAPQPAPVPQPVPAPAPQPAPVPQPVPSMPEAVSAPVQPAQPTQPVQLDKPTVAVCANCGKEIKADAKFCPFCGSPRN